MSGWTKQEEQELVELWENPKYTAATIAKIFDRTKSAICGKANRMGLPMRGTPKKARKLKSISKRPSLRQYKKIVSMSKFEDIGKIRIQDLKPRMCRWPCGDITDPDGIYFCGNFTLSGKSYCELHYYTSLRKSELKKKIT